MSITEDGAEGSRGRSGEEVETHVDDHGQCHRNNHERRHRQCPVPEREETQQPNKPAISYCETHRSELNLFIATKDAVHL